MMSFWMAENVSGAGCYYLLIYLFIYLSIYYLQFKGILAMA